MSSKMIAWKLSLILFVKCSKKCTRGTDTYRYFDSWLPIKNLCRLFETIFQTNEIQSFKFS